MAEISVKVSKKGDASGVDKAKIAKGEKPTPDEGASGQYPVWYNASCWNCWAVNRVLGDTNYYVGFYCWNCGAYCEV